MALFADLQMVNITLRVLSKPDVETLSTIYKVVTVAPDAGPYSMCTLHGLQSNDQCLIPQCFLSVSYSNFELCVQNLGLDWDERVLPSIGNEIVKAAVAQYNAEQLLTQRDRVSRAVSMCMPRSITQPNPAWPLLNVACLLHR